MEQIKINFTDFWGGFDPNNNFFVSLLSDKYEVVISEEPDILIFSCYGYKHLEYKCVKVFFSGENVRPNFFECDYSITFDYSSYKNRNYRFPLFLLYGDIGKLIENKKVEEIAQSKPKFCNMLVSNPKGKERNLFFQLLNRYKKVDSGGRYLNNIGYKVKDRFDFIKDYKFTLAFENSSFEGYTTEKIFQPMKVHSIPIYWGDPLAATDFNEKSFINVHKYSSFEKAVEAIAEIDQNDDMYYSMLREPYFRNNKIPENLSNKGLLDFLENIVTNRYMTEPVATSSKIHVAKLLKLRKRIISRIFRINYWHA